MTISGLIFDFDGLLIDTELAIFDILQDVYRSHGHELGLDLWQRAIGTHRGFNACQHLSELIGQPLDSDEFDRIVSERHIAACRELALLPGVIALLDGARQRGLKTAVASSSSHWWFEGWLTQHGIVDRFDALCGREDVEQVKPAPDLFLLAAERMGVPPSECLVFEDSPNGALAAQRAGMRCVAVPNSVTAWLAFPPVVLRVSSLAELTLDELLRLADQSGGGA